MSNSVETKFETSTAESSRPSVEVAFTEEPAIGIDHVFEILKNKRRRYVLRLLEASTEQLRLSDLAEQIAAWENDKEVKQITSQERKRVYVGLYQCHLPKMDDMGVIEFNKPRGIIERGENMDLVTKYLPDEDEGTDDPWRDLHVRVALATALTVSVLALLEAFTSLGVFEPGTVLLVGVIVLVSMVPFAR